MATTETPVSVQPVHVLTAKERKYDRQLRLWAASGQQALEEAHVLLLNNGSGVVGVETLKNLVLPGVGKFTIVDANLVIESDLRVNFFLEDSSLGKSRAAETCRLLEELNPEVQGHAVHEAVGSFISRTSLSDFSLIFIVSPARISDLDELRKKTWGLSIPLMHVHCSGFYSDFKIQLPTVFPIVDTHPDPESTQDLRLLNPWPELVELMRSKTENLVQMSDHEHGHVPYLLLLLYYLEQWRADHGGAHPTNYKEKSAFRDLIRSKARTSTPEGGEENYDEAVAAVLKSLTLPSIPSALREILAEEESRNPTAQSTSFWLISNAISSFMSENHALPLPGTIPDMKAQSVDYVALQNVYKTKARLDVASVTESVRALEGKLRPEGSTPIDSQEIEAFCKGAAHVCLLRGRPLRGEFETAKVKLAQAFSDEDSLMPIRIAFQAMETALDGSMGKDDMDMESLVELSDEPKVVQAMEDFVGGFVQQLTTDENAEEMAEAKGRIMKVLEELRRAGPGELHNIASLTGGMVAQEIIKILTKQYVTVDNTCIFDGVTSRSAVFRL